MGVTFPKHNIQGHNWPEGVRFPPVQLAVTNKMAKAHVTAKSKMDTQRKEKGKGKAAAKSKVKVKDEEMGQGDESDGYDVTVWDEENSEGEGDDSEDTDKSEGERNQGPRGVSNLKLIDLHLIGLALCDEDFPLYFSIYSDGGSDGKPNEPDDLECLLMFKSTVMTRLQISLRASSLSSTERHLFTPPPVHAAVDFSLMVAGISSVYLASRLRQYTVTRRRNIPVTTALTAAEGKRVRALPSSPTKPC